jgi:hypothetical protein
MGHHQEFGENEIRMVNFAYTQYLEDLLAKALKWTQGKLE